MTVRLRVTKADNPLYLREKEIGKKIHSAIGEQKEGADIESRGTEEKGLDDSHSTHSSG